MTETMQTFVPFEDFPAIARVLDKERLWKQVVEAKQILQTLRKINIREHAVDNPDLPSEVAPDEEIPWEKHPAVLMWVNNTHMLSDYMRFLWGHATEYHGVNSRWYKYETIYNWARKQGQTDYHPWWWGGPIHYSHRVKLCEKDWEHYNPLFPDVFDDDVGAMDYFWPTKQQQPPTVAGGLTMDDLRRVQEQLMQDGFTGDLTTQPTIQTVPVPQPPSLPSWPPASALEYPEGSGFVVKSVDLNTFDGTYIVNTVRENGDQLNHGMTSLEFGTLFKISEAQRGDLNRVCKRAVEDHFRKKAKASKPLSNMFPTRDPDMGVAMHKALLEEWKAQAKETAYDQERRHLQELMKKFGQP